MRLYLSLICLLGYILFSQVLSALAQDHTVQKIEGIEVVNREWVQEVVPFPLDKMPIEKYYSQKRGRPSFYIGRLTFSPTGDRIAFSINDDSIWVVRGDGSVLFCLSCGLEHAHSPYWSTDGRVITFIKGGDENNYGAGTIMHVAPDGTQRKIIGDYDLRKPGNKLVPPWWYSPDGSYVLRSSGKPLDNNRYIFRVKDQKVVAIYKTRGSTLNELWFPNGKEVLIEEFSGHGESELVIFSLTGERKTILPKGPMNLNPAIHPSGRLIAYFDYDESEIHFLTKDGSTNQLILKTMPTVSIEDIAWNPQGDLAFKLRNQIYFLKLKKRVP